MDADAVIIIAYGSLLSYYFAVVAVVVTDFLEAVLTMDADVATMVADLSSGLS
ncbi:MAG: hypothetical protein ACTHKA_20900 [Anaerocolumna jejuensis]